MIFLAKIDIFCKSTASPLSEAKTHWMVNWLQFLNQLYFVWRHATWTSHRSHLILIRCTTSMSLRSLYGSLLDRMLKSSPTRTESKILRRTFLSNTLKAVASVLNRAVHLLHKEVRVYLTSIIGFYHTLVRITT